MYKLILNSEDGDVVITFSDCLQTLIGDSKWSFDQGLAVKGFITETKTSKLVQELSK